MIKKISIQNFKSLANINIKCGNLNILCGLNSMGKSSIIQSLLLLRQSYKKESLLNEGLSLQGDLVSIGTAKEALYQFADKDEISFKIDFEREKGINPKEWVFSYQSNSETDEYNYAESEIIPYGEGAEVPEDIDSFPLFQPDKFNYLSAERWVKESYIIADYAVSKQRSLGKYGENTAYYLLRYGTEIKVDSSLLYKDTEIALLDYQVSAWMNEISPGSKVFVERIPGMNYVKLSYEFSENGTTTSSVSPLNVGFGMTYILPVVVALLSARPGDILLIENPESHVHPKGQSAIGRLMAKVAALGVQIFVETHSDHIINGVRVAVKQGVSPDFVKILFLTKGEDNKQMYTTQSTPKVDKDGRIDFWPPDFFDEWSNNLLELL